VSEHVLDASALLALIDGEPGAEAVERVLPDASMTTVNLAEVLAKLADRGVPDEQSFDAIAGLDLKLIDVGVPLARASARLRVETRSAGLSLGDRLCLALAELRQAPVLTADRAWAKLDLPLDIRVIR
jgi:PIN domain nuclease of toxin-antitoxin system